MDQEKKPKRDYDYALANDMANLRSYLVAQFPADANYELSDDRSVIALVRKLLERRWEN